MRLLSREFVSKPLLHNALRSFLDFFEMRVVAWGRSCRFYPPSLGCFVGEAEVFGERRKAPSVGIFGESNRKDHVDGDGVERSKSFAPCQNRLAYAL